MAEGQVEVGGKAQGADGEEVVVAQGVVRNADELDGPAGEVLEAVVDVVGGLGRTEAGEAEVAAVLRGEAVHHGGRDLHQGELGMLRILAGEGIEAEENAVLLERSGETRPCFRRRLGIGEDFGDDGIVGFAGDVDGRLAVLGQQALLQGRVDDVGVVAVAEQRFAQQGGLVQCFQHVDSPHEARWLG